MPNTTLAGASVCFHLTNPRMSNAQIAEALSLDNQDVEGFPACCFYSDGSIAAIRINEQHVVIFPWYQEALRLMSKLGMRVDIE